MNTSLLVVIQLRPTLCNPLDYNILQAPLSIGFSRQQYWSGLPFPSPGDLPDPEVEPRSPVLWLPPFELLGKPIMWHMYV